eukprot:scaffold878_cov89-Cylindrotheca_fusiformis.AAC.4
MHPKDDLPLLLDEGHREYFGTRSCTTTWPGTSTLQSGTRDPQQKEMFHQTRCQRHHRNQGQPEQNERAEHTLEMEPAP